MSATTRKNAPQRTRPAFELSASLSPLTSDTYHTSQAGMFPLPVGEMLTLIDRARAVGYGIESLTRILMNDELADTRDGPRVISVCDAGIIQEFCAVTAKTLAADAERLIYQIEHPGEATHG
ncbi:hypothetical protein [Paraburkholderia sp. MM6662-R1]|uniref:hypothetical protein n=1 Tax=Paraburkholderia sp. MM6662-R1 TaxID=2991066 RepID=UPI003D1CC622